MPDEQPQSRGRSTPPPIPPHLRRTRKPPLLRLSGWIGQRKKFVVPLLAGVALVVLLVKNFGGAPSAATLAERTSRSVVVIHERSADGSGLGTGFFVGDSLILTNYHVVRNATSLRIELQDGATLQSAAVVRTDPTHDLALLSVRYKGKALRLPNRDIIAQGSRVFALGHPEGLAYTFSEGIVSSIREIDGIHVLQITAPLSPGSSGGPIINDRGEVVGISTAVLTVGQNLNFAVSAPDIRDFLANQSALRSPTRTGDGRGLEPLIERGVYVVSFNLDNTLRKKLTFYILSSRDSLVARVGDSTEWSKPWGRFSGAASTFPFAVDYAKQNVRVRFDSAASSSLVSGHFEIHEYGDVDQVPFTASRSRELLDGKVLVLISGATTSRPDGFGDGGDGVLLAGELEWEDAGPATMLGAFEPYKNPGKAPPNAPTVANTLYGKVYGDTVKFTFGDLACALPRRSWPTGRGACWTKSRWFGLTAASAADSGVSRVFWRSIPKEFARVIGAKLTPTDDIELEYLVQQNRGVATTPQDEAFSAEIATITDYSADIETEPWPANLDRYRFHRNPAGGGELGSLGDRQLVTRVAGRWDTVSVPATILPAAPDSMIDGDYVPLQPGKFFAHWGIGQACSMWMSLTLTPAQKRALPACKVFAAFYDGSARRWKSVSMKAPSRASIAVLEALSADTVLLRLWQDEPATAEPFYKFFLIDPKGGEREIPPPLQDSMSKRLYIASSAVSRGESWAIARYCSRDEHKCWARSDLPSLILRWNPGRAARIVRTDSTKDLGGAELIATSTGRVLISSRSTVRPAAEGFPILSHGLTGDQKVRFALEDSLTGRVALVSGTGEIAAVRLDPVVRQKSTASPWKRVWVWMGDLLEK